MRLDSLVARLRLGVFPLLPKRNSVTNMKFPSFCVSHCYKAIYAWNRVATGVCMIDQYVQSRGGSVSIVIGPRGLILCRGRDFSVRHPVQTVPGPTRSPIQWVTRALSDRGVHLTAHLHLVPRLRMLEAIPPLPNTSSWRGSK